jgi:hypothetical protein
MTADRQRQQAQRRDLVLSDGDHDEPDRRDGRPSPSQPVPPAADGGSPQSRYALIVRDGQPLPTRTRMVGGPQDGRVDEWFTLTPEELPDGWVFPRRVHTPEGEVLVEDLYRRRPGQAVAYGGEVVYDFAHTSPADGN